MMKKQTSFIVDVKLGRQEGLGGASFADPIWLDLVKYFSSLCLFLSGIFLVQPGRVEAATIEAKSVSFNDVSAAVASARDGDTVHVPAGTAIWTSSLTISGHITLQGAGAELTVIVDEIPRPAGRKAPDNARDPAAGKDPPFRGGAKMAGASRGDGFRPGFSEGGRGCLLFVVLKKDLPFRMTGFTFRGGSTNSGIASNGEIRCTGISHSFRIDHCTFDQLHGTSLAVNGFLWGVIDHCRFKTQRAHPITVEHKDWNGKNNGNGSWADDPYWGTEKFIFIEDNVFEDSSRAGTGIDSFEGARFVVRYNHFHNTRLTMHGTEGQGRGAKQVEEYNNTYVNDTPQAGQIRSGCIITYDNTWTNVARGHVLQTFRLFQRSPHWGPADGQNLWDKNVPNGTVGYWARGTYSGENGATVLTDDNPKKTWYDANGTLQTGVWPANRWYEPGAAYIVRNKTREESQGTIRTFAIGSDANTVKCSALTFFGTYVTFNKGDTYEIWKISQALDQPGTGKSDLLTGLGQWNGVNMTRPYGNPHQVTEPCYSWNNKNPSKGADVNLASTEPSIKEGRDFFNNTPKPGYKPFTYPHPLVTAGSRTGNARD
jgi:hypothetical protein